MKYQVLYSDISNKISAGNAGLTAAAIFTKLHSIFPLESGIDSVISSLSERRTSVDRYLVPRHGGTNANINAVDLSLNHPNLVGF